MLKLTYSNLEFQNFPGEDPRTPLFKGRGGQRNGGEEREGKGREGGRGRIGKGGEVREGTGEGRREGRNGGGEGPSILAPPPLETSSGSPLRLTMPVLCLNEQRYRHTFQRSRRGIILDFSSPKPPLQNSKGNPLSGRRG